MQWILATSFGRTAASILIVLFAVLAALGAGIRIGTMQERRKTEIRFRRSGWEADRRIDNADIGFGASDDDNREWLRERGRRGSNH